MAEKKQQNKRKVAVPPFSGKSGLSNERSKFGKGGKVKTCNKKA